MKTGIIGILLMIVAFVLFATMMNKCSGELIKEVEKYETRVGDLIILKNDTLMIIDYSFMESNFTLEDGRKISIDLLDKLECVGK